MANLIIDIKYQKLGMINLFAFAYVMFAFVTRTKALLGQAVKTPGARARCMTIMASQIDKCLSNPKWPEEWPFKEEDFRRQDETSDSLFYGSERFVHHIDDGARAALTKYYKENIAKGSDVLDICSSWVSHYPTDLKLGRVAGLGMVRGEMKENSQLTEFTVKDLNIDPQLPYEENSFDVVTCVVSADYLTQPLQVFREISRVLRPGGKAIVSQSNRCFPTKAINIWLNTNDLEHVFIIGAYFHYTNSFHPPVSKDISPMFGDPMYIIEAISL